MAKLQLVKTRTGTGTIDADTADLRGLGNDPVIQDIQPIAVLTVSAGGSILQKLKSYISTKFSNINVTESSDKLNLTVVSKVPENFKLHVVDLYVTYLEIHNEKEFKDEVVGQLWLSNPLAFHIQKTEATSHAIEWREDGTLWDSVLKLAYPVNHYLAQAGFKVELTPDTLSIGEADLQRHFQELLMETSMARVAVRAEAS